MEDLDLVGIDLAKNVFQLHGCSSTGEVIFRKQLRRDRCIIFRDPQTLPIADSFMLPI